MLDVLKKLLGSPTAELPRGVRWLMVGGVMLYALGAALIMDRWQHRGGQCLSQLGFGYGVLIQAIQETGEYRVAPGVHYPDVAFSAHRLPFIPFFLMALGDVFGDNLGRVALAKCLLFGAVLAAAFNLVLCHGRAPLWVVLLFTGVAFTMPRWVLNVFEVGLEEAYNIPVLTLLFATLWFSPEEERRKWAWGGSAGLMLALLVFLKSSMVYWCLAVPVLLWLQERSRRNALVALGLVAVALCGLAAFNQLQSGRFTIGSSWEGWNLYKGNCEHALATYPPYSLDLLDYEGKVVADRPLADEWEHNGYFKQKAVDFIKAHPGQFVELCLRKAWIFYGEVRASGLAQRGESRSARPEYLLQIPWMVVFRVMLWAAIGLALVTLWRAPWRSAPSVTALTYLGFLFLYSGFHVVGFAYERHVMPVVMPTALYLVWRWSHNQAKAGIG